jgi:hypothetical protein
LFRCKALAIPPRYAVQRGKVPVPEFLDPLPSYSLPESYALVTINGLGLVKGSGADTVPNFVVILENIPLTELNPAECRKTLLALKGSTTGDSGLAATMLQVIIGYYSVFLL